VTFCGILILSCSCFIFVIFLFFFFFFNDTATTEIYTLSLHDALPISVRPAAVRARRAAPSGMLPRSSPPRRARRSEEHTSELQSLAYLVCRLLLEKQKKLKSFRILHVITKQS